MTEEEGVVRIHGRRVSMITWWAGPTRDFHKVRSVQLCLLSLFHFLSNVQTFMLKLLCHIRKCFEEVTAALQDSTSYTVKEILSISEKIAPSDTIGTGGFLLEYFILVRGNNVMLIFY